MVLLSYAVVLFSTFWETTYFHKAAIFPFSSVNSNVQGFQSPYCQWHLLLPFFFCHYSHSSSCQERLHHGLICISLYLRMFNFFYVIVEHFCTFLGNISIYSSPFAYFFFLWPWHAACRILIPWPRIEPRSPQWKPKF